MSISHTDMCKGIFYIISGDSLDLNLDYSPAAKSYVHFVAQDLDLDSDHWSGAIAAKWKWNFVEAV